MSLQKIRKNISYFALVAVLTGLVFVTIVTITPAEATNSTQMLSFKFSLGKPHNAPGQFGEPWAIAIDNLGNIYVTDTVSDLTRVQKFNSSGNYISQFGSFGTANGQFEEPLGIAVDSSRNIYVLDHDNNRIQKFNSSGNYISQIGCVSGACTGGSANGQFSAPNSVTVDSSDNIYVVDSANHRVQKFSSSGTFLLKFQLLGSNSSYTLGDIAVDSSGNIYFADEYYNRIQKFDSTGHFLSQIGCVSGNCTEGSADGQFNFPDSVTIDGSNNIYVMDDGNHRIQKFDSTGNFLSKFAVVPDDAASGSYEDIALDGSGNIYAVDEQNSHVEKFSSSGTFLSKFGFATQDDQFGSPFDVAADSSGNIYVTDIGKNRIQKFNSTGNLLSNFGTYGSGTGKLGHPWSIGIDNSGNIYVGDELYLVMEKFSPLGSYLLNFTAGFNTGLFNTAFPTNVAFDSSGNVYFTSDNQDYIKKYDSSGIFLLQFGTNGTGNGQFDRPDALATDSSGNIYVADTLHNRIQKFNSTGHFLSKFGTEGSDNGQLEFPQGIALDSSGNIYVADTDNNRIQKFNPSGNYTSQFGTFGHVSSDQFYEPSSMKIVNGTLYVVDAGNYRIQVFDLINAPATPSLITASGSSNIITISWNASAGATSYNVYRSGSSSGPFTKIITQSGTSFSDTNIPYGTTYYYKVSAVNGGGESGLSSVASATAQLNAPTGVKAITINSTAIKISWNATMGADYYIVYSSITPYSSFTTSTASQTATSYTDHNLSPGKSYYYKVRAINSSGRSLPSNMISNMTSPLAPTGVKAITINSTAIKISWNAPHSATSYSIFRFILIVSRSEAPVGTSSSTTFTDNGLSANTKYYYTISATNAGGASEPSTPISLVTMLPTPTSITANPTSSHSVHLSWTASAGATSYKIFRSTSNTSRFAQPIGTPAITSFDDTHLTSGTTYYYKISAVNANTVSALSSIVSATTP